MNNGAIFKNTPVVKLPRLVISILSSFIFVVIAETVVAWEYPITVGPDHLVKDLTLSSMVMAGSPSDEVVEYIMAMNTIQADSVEIADYARVELWAPIISLKPGFHAKPDLGNGYFRAGIPTFKVNCVNMVDPSTVPVLADGLDNFFNDNPDSTAYDPDPADHDTFRSFCENEINILNHHFVNENALPGEAGRYREQLIRFRLNQAWEWIPPANSADLAFHTCLTYGTGCLVTEPPDNDEWSDTFNASSYHTDGAISMVYFKHPEGKNYSYGKLNYAHGLAPWVMINYNRSDTNLDAIDDGDVYGNGDDNKILDDDEGRKAAHEHEFGHIFSVHHTWDERVERNRYDPAFPDKNFKSNIMNYGETSADGAYDATNQPCNSGIQGWGDRAMGFWFEPWNGEASGVCQYWNKSWLDYNNDGMPNRDDDTKDPLEIRELWSQVEIILYSAKHYKETWAD